MSVYLIIWEEKNNKKITQTMNSSIYDVSFIGRID